MFIFKANFLAENLGCKKLHTNNYPELNLVYLKKGLTLKNSGSKARNETGYKFNGKELDEETGNYYYGARYYNPKWSLWLSVDNEYEKYPDWSPYNYTLQNPVKYVDPDGNSPIWKPNRKGHLIAEKGDNMKTLANYLGRNVNDVSKEYGISKNYQFKEGTTVIVNNNVTEATTNSKGLSWDKYKSVSNPREYVSQQDRYMCDQCAQMATNGEDINPQNAGKYGQFISWKAEQLGFEQVDNLDGVPINGGIITIGSDHTVSSYGQSKDGTQYVLNKGGYDFMPEVETLQETINHFNEIQETNYTMDDVKYYQKID